ncbi:MAG: TatD family hydrolase [Rikenellaceae bacterium]|nr:TatD family hydrolase [Rikenellaceae bacterium]
MLIDTHSHLYDEAFDTDRNEVLQRARDGGIERIIVPAIDSGSHERLFALCREFPGVCYPLMGLHPTSVNDNPRWKKELEIVERYILNSSKGEGVKIYGIGEVGIDLYWSRDYAKQQEEAFRIQIELAIEKSLPLVIHTREAWPQTRRILYSYKAEKLRGVLHSFSGTGDDYNFFCEFGEFLFGIGGPVTYKNSSLASIIPQMQMDRIVLETDSPYLPPVPYRGRRNESSYLKYILRKVSELTGIEAGQVESTTTANAMRMFGLNDGK